MAGVIGRLVKVGAMTPRSSKPDNSRWLKPVCSCHKLPIEVHVPDNYIEAEWSDNKPNEYLGVTVKLIAPVKASKLGLVLPPGTLGIVDHAWGNNGQNTAQIHGACIVIPMSPEWGPFHVFTISKCAWTSRITKEEKDSIKKFRKQFITWRLDDRNEVDNLELIERLV